MLFIDFRERERERKTSIAVPLIYAFIGCFLYVSWLGIEPATMAYGDNSLTNWATQPGQKDTCFRFTMLNKWVIHYLGLGYSKMDEKL